MRGNMLLLVRHVFREQYEALAHLQQCNTPGRIARPFCGLSAKPWVDDWGDQAGKELSADEFRIVKQTRSDDAMVPT